MHASDEGGGAPPSEAEAVHLFVRYVSEKRAVATLKHLRTANGIRILAANGVRILLWRSTVI